MHILALVLIVIGVSASLIALGTLIYLLPKMSGHYKHENQRHPSSPDWMALSLRLYKPYIVAYFVAMAVSVAAFSLAGLLERHSS